MTKSEFLVELKQLLSGEVSPEVLMDTYRYYDGYIDEQIRSGLSEEEVIEQLGKPNLIARSVIAAQQGNRAADLEYTEDGKTKKIHRVNMFEEKPKKEKKEFKFDFHAWYAKVLLVLVAVLFLVLIFAIVLGILTVLLPIVLPVLLVLGLIYLIYKLVRG